MISGEKQYTFSLEMIRIENFPMAALMNSHVSGQKGEEAFSCVVATP